MTRSIIVFAITITFGSFARAQVASPVDTSKIGPQLGATVPPFSGPDQFGRTQSLQTVIGPQGAMLVFFRSADW